MKIAIELLIQRVKENIFIAEVLLRLVWLLGLVYKLLGNKEKAFKFLSQAHRTSRNLKLKKSIEPFIKGYLDITWHNSETPRYESAKRLIDFGKIQVFSAPEGHQKGVIFVKFSETFKILATCFDMPRLLADYIIVLEPSWSGYCDKDILFFSQFKDPVFVLAAERDDYRFLEALDTNLIPVDRGPCDWVNPALSELYLSEAKEYDIVMNSNWGREKRHYVFFSALKKIDKPLRIALVGMPWRGRSLADARELASWFGLQHELSFFESIPYEQVMEINARSKIAVLMSLKEGSNRAIAEGFFCNTPGLILDVHVGGINKNMVSQTGRRASEANLHLVLQEMLETWQHYQPRVWALENISCYKSTELVTNNIREVTAKTERPWTGNIAVRTNSPEQGLVKHGDHERLRPVSLALSSYLKEH